MLLRTQKKREFLCIIGGHVSCYSHYGKQYGGFLKKLKELPYNLIISLLDIYPKKTKMIIWINSCMLIFIAALFTVAKIWKQPKCSSTNDQINEMWDIYVFIHIHIIFLLLTHIHIYTYTNTHSLTCIHTHSGILLLLLLSPFSRVRLCASAETAAHTSLGFSRQEHWSGLPFPSPTHESEKWKWSRSVVSGS